MFLCIFHFKQSIRRKIQELGLKIDYSGNDKIRKWLKLPKVLRYIPYSDVISCFAELKSKLVTNGQRITDFYVYFENNYIRSLHEVIKGRGRNSKNSDGKRKTEICY